MNTASVFSFIVSVCKLYFAHADEIAALAADVEKVFGASEKDTSREVMSIAEARRLADLLGLERSAAFDALGDDTLTAICNGFGPDKWPAGLRTVATWWYRHLQCADKIHDVEYQFADGTKAGWSSADARFSRNGSRILSYRYPISRPWLWPERAALWAKKHLAIRLLAIGGWDAYHAAYLRRTDIVK